MVEGRGAYGRSGCRRMWGLGCRFRFVKYVHCLV